MALTILGVNRRPPGALVAACAAVLSIGLVFAMIDWWPGQGHRLDDASNWLIRLGLGVLLFFVGIVWALKTVNVLGGPQRWSWWIMPAPAIVIAALLAGWLIPGPSFEAARGEFDTAVADMAGQDMMLDDVEIGPFTISSIIRFEDGTIHFADGGQDFWYSSGGWVYSPAGPPKGEYYTEFEATHMDGPWYEFRATKIF